MKSIKLYVYHANEDDPKKCSAKKLHRFNHAILKYSLQKIPKHCILLNPYAKKSISPEDRKICEQHGLLAIDCSWNNADQAFSEALKNHHSRSLPFMIAVNPVNYGKVLQLSTIEAFAAALYIIGHQQQSEEILQIYKWGPHFIELNKEPLTGYSQAKNSAEIIKIMEQYID